MEIKYFILSFSINKQYGGNCHGYFSGDPDGNAEALLYTANFFFYHGQLALKKSVPYLAIFKSSHTSLILLISIESPLLH